MEEEDAFSHFGAFLSPIPAFPICFHCFLGFDKVFAIIWSNYGVQKVAADSGYIQFSFVIIQGVSFISARCKT